MAKIGVPINYDLFPSMFIICLAVKIKEKRFRLPHFGSPMRNK